MPAGKTTEHCEAVLDEIERVVVGKRSALTLILTAVLARGHVLIEDLPGLGKTLIARSFAAALGLRFTRVQFTARGPARLDHLRHAVGPLRVPGGTHLH
jgi:MoxR-like ATPase